MGASKEDAQREGEVVERPNAIGSGNEYPQEVRDQFRLAFLENGSARRTGKKLGIPSRTAYLWAAQLRADPTFLEELATENAARKHRTEAAYDLGLRVTERIARDRDQPDDVRLDAAKVLIKAPADLARAQNQVNVKLSGGISLDEITSLRKRIEDIKDDGPEGSR